MSIHLLKGYFKLPVAIPVIYLETPTELMVMVSMSLIRIQSMEAFLFQLHQSMAPTALMALLMVILDLILNAVLQQAVRLQVEEAADRKTPKIDCLDKSWSLRVEELSTE
jgi:hypothetical protein